METSDYEQFRQLIGDALGFYGRDLSAFALDAWWQATKRYEYQDVANALSVHVQDPDRGQFPPKPADVIRLLDGQSGDRSLHAWTKVDRAIRELGPYRSVVFDDHRIHAVIDEMGGWIALCEVASEKDLEFKANEFRKRYQAYVLRQPQAWPPRLIGYTEAENRRMGREDAVPEPMLIGDPDRAHKVMERAKDRGRLAQPASEAIAKLTSGAA